MADTSNSVLFDQPGPKGRRTIRIVNWVAALIFVGVLVLILMRLHNPPDGENQLSWELWKPALEREAWTDFYLPGLWMTVKASIVAVVGSVVFGLVFGVGRRRGALLHARRQPFGQTRQQPADDEVHDCGHDQRLQDVEVHRAETARLLQQIGVHDDRSERGILEHHDQLRDGGRQHRVDGLRHLDLHQRLRLSQSQCERRLTLPVR